MQLSKTIYFSDYSRSKARSGLTVSFPESEKEVFHSVEHLSSYTLRKLLGYQSYQDLEDAARTADHAIATFARRLITKKAPKNAPNKFNAGIASEIQSTFRGGKGSPLHDWFPYLEGYSPEFVNSILSTFAPTATTVLDPFCGSGTTALVAALRGLTGMYAEVNPACRFIIDAKKAALQVPEGGRSEIADSIWRLAENLDFRISKYERDASLEVSFQESFGERPFFDPQEFDHVLRTKSMINDIKRTDRAISQFVTVAALRSLVPGSLLVRRGDLRFRNAKELAKQRPSFLTELRSSLHIIASDLLDAKTAAGSVRHVCDDARSLSSRISEPVDVIVTSPPYLNGTNYFRNTKIELWFLCELKRKTQLREYRDRAITSGINDVTIGKTNSYANGKLPGSVLEVVSQLEASAYDQRIPMMVASYFQEMAIVARQLRAVSHEKTKVAVDLGDSCYGSVSVPTHDIFKDLMAECGFRRVDEVVLRERQSRDGRRLTQTLQVFDIDASRKRVDVRRANVSKRKWNTFKTTLPHQTGDMAKRNWGHPWHSMCSYQGKLKPAIAHALVSALLPAKGGRVLDPFSGVGTIPLEARLSGHAAYGFDISPAAVAISRAKLESINPSEVETCLQKVDSVAGKAAPKPTDKKLVEAIRFNGPLDAYFHPQTLAEILAARAHFRRNPPRTGAESLVFSCLLHILHGNRPYALSRRSHPITPFSPTGPTEYRNLMERLRGKVDRSLLALTPNLTDGSRSFFQDATAAWPDEVDSLDAIITSPPFFDSTRFHTANWMRLWFAGWDSKDFACRPSDFIDERQKTSFEVYDAIFRQGRDRMLPGGYFAVHLGKSVKCDMAAELKEVGSKYFKLDDMFVESVEHCESHGIRDKGTVTHHQYMLFKKVS